MSLNGYFQAILYNFTLGFNDRSIYGAGVSRPQTQKLRPHTPQKKSGKTQTPTTPPPKKKSGKLRPPPPPERTKKRHLKSEFGFFDFFDWLHKKHIGLITRYSFSGSIPPKFEHKLRRHKQRFGKIASSIVFSLNFIRLLPVVITPSVTSEWTGR